MKRIIYLSIVILTLSCSSDDDQCTCTGEFQRVDSDEISTFFVNDVDCETGERNDDFEQEDVVYIGCQD